MSEDRVKKLNANKRYLFCANLFTELKFVNAFIQLFYLSRGISLGEIFYLSLVLSTVVLLTEFPSSYLGDVIGRKKTLLLGVFFMAVGNLITLFAYGFLPVALGVVVTGLGISFVSGVDEALLYDSIKELKQERSMTKISGRYFASTSLAKVFTPFLAAFVAKDLAPWQFSALLAIDLGGIIAAFFCVLMITEPNTFELEGKSKKLEILKQALRTLLGNKVLLKLSLNKIGVFIGTFVYWRVYQIFLKENQVGVFVLGLIPVLYSGVLTLFSWNVGKIKQKLGAYILLKMPPIVGILALCGVVLTSSLPILVISTVLVFCIGTLRDSVFLSQIQPRLSSDSRATTTSALNFIQSLLFIPILSITPLLVEKGLIWAPYVSIFIFVITLIFANITRQDIIEES